MRERAEGKGTSWLLILLLQCAVVLNASSGVFTKLAARESFLSWRFLLFYGCALFVLLVYAVLWQQFLKRMPLNTAYGNCAVGMVWSVIFGALFFQETIRWNMILGTLTIVAGLYMVVTADG